MAIDFTSKPLFPKNVVERVQSEVTEQGFSIIEHYFKTDEVEIFRQGVEQAIEKFEVLDNPQRALEKYHLHDLLNSDIMYAKTFEDPRIQQLLTPFLSEFWVLYAYTSSSVPPQSTNYARRIHNDCPRNIPGYITNMGLIWPLNDYNEKNGAVRVLPGSHKSLSCPSEADFEKYAITINCMQGSLILFNALLYHRTEENKTLNWRHALTMNACRSFMKQRFDWVRMLKKEITNQLNSQARRIIGFDTRVPVNLDEYFVAPEQRLYKGGQG